MRTRHLNLGKQLLKICLQTTINTNRSRAVHFTSSTMQGQPKVFVTRRIPQRAMDLLKEKCEVSVWDSDDAIPKEVLLEKVKGVDAIYCLLTDTIDAEVLDAAGPNLKSVSTLSDLSKCGDQENGSDRLTEAMAELIVTLLLSTARRIPEGVEAVKSGEWGTWKPMWLLGHSVQESTVGVVGLSGTTSAVIRRLRPFGVRRFLRERTSSPREATKQEDVDYVSFEELVHESDFVIACCEFSDKTRSLFGESAFQRMKNSAVFINASRDGVVDHDALYAALSDSQISAAGLDMTPCEPPSSAIISLSGLANCLVWPLTVRAKQLAVSTMAELTARNILAALNEKTV